MIHTHCFIYEHLQRSPYGLLFWYRLLRENPFFLAMREGRVEISTFNFKFRCPIWAGCNGLILEYEIDHATLCIANPVTKQHFALPPSPTRIRFHYLSGTAYAAASMEYKVVLTELFKGYTVRSYLILTAGVDDWWRRNVCIEHLPLTARNILDSVPLVTEGFIHWAKCGPEVLTLNVETEVITETSVPIPHVYAENKRMQFMSTGRYLTFLIELEKFKWEVWEMKPDRGEWRKLRNIIDLEAHKCRVEEAWCKGGNIQPIGWLEYPEVLLIGIKGYATQTCFVYKFHTGEMDSIELPESVVRPGTEVHKNSLVWLGGC